MMESAHANYEYADVQVPLSANTASAQRATPEELVALAGQIWKEVNESGVLPGDSAGNDALLEDLQKQYHDFSTSFPIVLRWMVQMRVYRPKAMKKFLMKHATATLDTREAFLELQAEYLVMLYRESHERPNELHVRNYKQTVIKQLLDEDKEFLEVQRAVEEDLAKQAKLFDADRRQKLYAHLMLARGQS
jgi:hypothetical protein